MMRLRAFDVFAAFGTLLFVGFAALVHYDRWVAVRGDDAVAEFLAYAALLVVAIWIAWLWFRRYPWPPWALAMIATGVLLHFAGGLVIHDGGRLYDVVVIGIRFDKFVHFANAFIAVRITAEIFRFEGLALGRFHRPAIVLIVLGLGALVEIAEYVVLSTIPDAGVGFYHNTLQDLIGNLCGSVTSAITGPGSDRRAAAREADSR
jgi:hypothetical protein